MKKSNLAVAYRAEMFRLFKGKGVWIFFTVVTVIILFLLIPMSQVMSDIPDSNELSVPEDIDAAIAELDAEEAELINSRENSSQDGEIDFDSELYKIKARKAVYNYFKDNGISEGTFKNFLINENGFTVTIKDVYDYVSYAMQISVSLVVMFYGSITACSIAGERKIGTLKTELLRPVNRKDIIFAKFLSHFTFASVTIIAEFFIAAVVGLIVADGFMTPVIMVFNATGVSIVNPFVALLIILFFGLIFLAIMMMGAILIGVICNGKASAILLFLFVLGGMLSSQIITNISMSLFHVDLATFLPINACDLTRLFSLSGGAGIGTVIPYMIFTVIYAVGFTVLSYILFNRQDN